MGGADVDLANLTTTYHPHIPDSERKYDQRIQQARAK
jgi:hypothetical protein